MVMIYKEIYKAKYHGMMFRVLQHKETSKYHICRDLFFNIKYLYDFELKYRDAAIDCISPDMWYIHIWHFGYKERIKLL